MTSLPEEAGKLCGKLNRGLPNVNLPFGEHNLGGILAVAIVLCCIDVYVFSGNAHLLV